MNAAVRTEIHGFELRLDNFTLVLTSDGEDLIAPIALATEEAERLRLQLAKTQLPEWNQFDELRSRSELRYRRCLGAWLMMCLAAFSAYLGYPSYVLCLVLAGLSVFLWWRAGSVENQAAQEAQVERQKFQPDWGYLRRRLQEAGDGANDELPENP
jgi:hypothetical protein